MKKQLLILLMTISGFHGYSQASFGQGYFIDNSGKIINCKIKNMDWKNNPTEFEYKLSEDAAIQMESIKSVKEFGIHKISKYIRHTVRIDRSGEGIGNLDNEKNPVFKEEELFLKVLVEGKANLYAYQDGNLKRYFYNKEGADIEQLVFKNYKISHNKTGKNNQFKQQLWNDLKCSAITMNKVEKLDYRKSKLIDFFVKYNKCSNSEFVSFEKKQERDLFNVTLRPRINNASLSIDNAVIDDRNIDFGNKWGFGFGVEAEVPLPFGKSEWAIFIEPTYQYFKSEKTTEANNVSGGILVTNVDYKSIELPIGLRYYFFLNNKARIFINASYVIDFNSESSIVFNRSDGSELSSVNMESQDNIALGIGYKYSDTYSLELRYLTGREVIGNSGNWSSDYKTLSIIFGYSLF